MEWRKGQAWPWQFPRPTFPGRDGGPLEIVWAVDDAEMRARGYPDGLTIPDHYGRTSDYRGIVFEMKSKDHVKKALAQLGMGLRILPVLGWAVDRLGLSLERFEPVEGYFATQSGQLLSHKRLVRATPLHLGSAPSLPVMVEQRRGHG